MSQNWRCDESEARLTALLEQLPVGIGLTDREGRFLIRNSLLNNFVGDRLSSLDPMFAARWHAWDEEGRYSSRLSGRVLAHCEASQ